MIEAVIFDFDGIIADTMHDNCRAWKYAFDLHGFSMTADEYFRLEGMGRFQIAQYFIERYGLNPHIKENVVSAKESYYKANNSFRIFEHVLDIFTLLKNAKIPIAIVTGASKERFSKHTEDQILLALSALVTSDDVKFTKPHPEPYLKAVEALGKSVERCLVIENAIFGIQSAKSAGCKCFAITTTMELHELKGADKIFTSHKDLLKEFKSLLINNN